MKDLSQKISINKSVLSQVLILAQLFLIIFIYHILKDLKDTLVITSSDAGAGVIPFIKIWVILPFAILTSYLFNLSYQKFGRETTFYMFVGTLLSCYGFFAFCLYPHKELLELTGLSNFLSGVLPIGCKGFISMFSFWIYTFFYLAAELWAMMILTVLFWGYLNDITSGEKAKSFYPICVFTGNCAGILSGQTSSFLCKTLCDAVSWQSVLQWMILIVIISGIAIMLINRALTATIGSIPEKERKKRDSLTFKQSLISIFQSKSLLCIALMVIGFGLTTNLVEVIWKDTIRTVYPSPQHYNAYINQLTSIIGILAVMMALISRSLFYWLSWLRVALITPVILFITSLTFFIGFQCSNEILAPIAELFNVNSFYLVMTLGSLYYVFAMTAKYTIFDMCKEMAFLSIDSSERMKAKSVIDTVGSRLGKSGSSCLYQILLIIFGSTMGSVPIVGVVVVVVIGVSIVATKTLGEQISEKELEQPVAT